VSVTRNLRRVITNLPRYARRWLEWLVVLGETSPPSTFPSLEAVKRPPSRAPQQVTRYATSALFLHRCHRYLTRRPTEQLHLVTGFVLEDCQLMTDLIAVAQVRRTTVGASASPADLHKPLTLMHTFGLRCAGLFHSHPGRGVGSTQPSSTDLTNHRSWERAYPLVGAVFSQDGVIRFFGGRDRVRVEVYGKKIEKLHDNLYRLQFD